MFQKKPISKSKLLLTFMAFVVVLYGLFAGGAYLKAQNDFKPYHKLAVELNSALGGGYTIKETKNCGLFEPACPTTNLRKGNFSFSLAEATTNKKSIKQVLTNHGFTILNELECLEDNTRITFCGFNAVSSKNNSISARVGLDKEEISITLEKTGERYS